MDARKGEEEQQARLLTIRTLPTGLYVCQIFKILFFQKDVQVEDINQSVI